MCFWTRIARIWRIFIRVIRVIRVRITIREFGIKYLLFKYWEDSIQICSYAELIRQKNAFLLPSSLILFWLKRASFATKESLFFLKVGKVTFFARKSFLCRYFALSLHLETGRESGQFRSRLPKVPSLCLRFAFALPSLWLRSRRRRKAQGNAAAETRHKREVFDIFAYWSPPIINSEHESH